MNDLQRHLTQNFAHAFDRYEVHMRNANPQSIEDLQAVVPLNMEMMIAQWAASLDVKTRHDLMRASIDAIR
jgi:gamma-glutamylcysteine synthetase